MNFPGMGLEFSRSGANSAVTAATKRKVMKARILTEIKISKKQTAKIMIMIFFLNAVIRELHLQKSRKSDIFQLQYGPGNYLV